MKNNKIRMPSNNIRERFKSNKKSSVVAKWTKSIIRTIFLIGMCFVMLYPVLFILSSSFKTLDDVYNPSVIWIPQHFSLEAMKIAMDVMNFSKSFVKTIALVFPSVFFQLITVLLAGYGFARFKFKGKNVLFGLLIFTIIVPVQSYIVPLYVNFKLLNLLDSNFAFYLQALLGAGIRSGLYIFMVRQFFKNMPVELEEAAMIDGCSIFKTFIKIMLPNTLPLMATVSVFSIVWYWNDYFMSSMFFRSEFPLSVNLTFLNTLLTTSDKVVPGLSSQEILLLKEPILASGCLIAILPLLIIYIFVQRYFTEGIERSGIVG